MELVISTFWKEPLRKLYFEGPSIFFWANRTSEDICSDLTNVKSAHWVENMEVCSELKDLTFNSFYVGINSFFYFMTIIFIFYLNIVVFIIRCCIRFS